MPNPPPPKAQRERSVLDGPLQPTAPTNTHRATWSAAQHQLDASDVRSARKFKPTKLVTSQGTMLIEDLDVPEDVKELLFDLDLNNDGHVGEEELKGIAEHLAKLHEELGAGCSTDKICDLLDLVIRQVDRKKHDASFMEYAHLPENIQKCFRVWDTDGNGRVDASELASAVHAWQELQKESALMKKLLFAACMVIVLMFVGMFVMGMVTAELAKEFKAGGSGDNPRMLSKSGDAIQVASSDTQIDTNGMMMTRAVVPNNTRNGRNSPDLIIGSVATQTAKSKSRLVSTLPNSFWDSLNEISVHSDKGHTLNLKIQGYARIPLRNSRCGNVLKLYTSVDGAIVLDSDDMSFEGKLDTLFENAGFEVAIGGAAGRRLASTAGVDGFFDHVSKAESEGSWKCGDIPLPRMPAYNIQKFDAYLPCKNNNEIPGKQKMTGCDSVYGGYTAGTMHLPANHASATLSRVDKVQAALQNGKVRTPTQQGTLWSKSSHVRLRSPSYEVQRTTTEGHPGQELIQVTSLTEKKSVSFQQMHADPEEQAIRNFCKGSSKTGSEESPNPILKFEQAKQDNSIDTSMHFEYVGLEGEGDKVYRRFRMMPSKDFNAWMETSGKGQVPNSIYHYWDDAANELFTPYRLIDPSGTILVYNEVSQIETDEEVEVFLKNTVNATKFGSFAKPYKFECDEIEKGSESAEYGIVPQMSGGGDLAPDAVEFWARYLLDANAFDGLDPDHTSGDVGSMSRAARDGNDTSTFLKPAFTFLATLTATSPLHGFANYALRSQQKLAMPSACSEPCAQKKMVQNYIDEHGDDEICSAPHLTQLVECITGLDPHVASHCAQSPFFQRYNMDCVQKKSGRGGRRLHVGGAKVDQLSDGTLSLDLEPLDHTARMSLEAALSASGNGDSAVGLKDSRFLFNASSMRTTPTLLLSNFAPSKSAHSRRLLPYGACDGYQNTGVCFEFNLPGIMYLKFKLESPYFSTGASSSGWAFSVELAGNVPLSQLFGVPRTPLYADLFLSGGVNYLNSPSCPHIPYTFDGEASMRFSAGVDIFGLITVDAIAFTLTIGAYTPSVTGARSWRTRTDARRRREYFWSDGRRRRATWRNHHIPYSCEVSVFVKAELEMDLVATGFKVFVRGSFGLSSHVLTMTVGAEYWIGFGGWLTALSHPLLTTTLR